MKLPKRYHGFPLNQVLHCFHGKLLDKIHIGICNAKDGLRLGANSEGMAQWGFMASEVACYLSGARVLGIEPWLSVTAASACQSFRVYLIVFILFFKVNIW